MERVLEKYLISRTSGLRQEYTDKSELESNLRGLNAALEVENDLLRTLVDDKEERRLNISEIRKKQDQVKAALSQFPPYPELPPTRPLIKISGVVEELTVRKVIGYFDFSEYTSLKEQAKRKQERDNAGAVLAMITQSLAGSIIHARVNDGERKKSRCIYLEGKMGGKKFSGWLGKTNVQVGDNIEMVVMPDDDNNILYALANPQQRTVSMVPGCVVGLGTYSFLKVTMFTFIFFFFLYCFLAFVARDQPLGVFVFYLIASSITSVVIHRGVIRDKTPQCRLFEEICAVLGIPGGHNLDLMSFTDKKIADLKTSGDWVPPEQHTIAMPQETSKNSVEFFYYY